MPRERGQTGEVQDLLYLQAASTSLASEVIGMAVFMGGEEAEVPASPDDWPYHTPADAIKDGWRVLKVPDSVVLLDDKRNYGLGCEFVFERFVSHPSAREAVGQ